MTSNIVTSDDKLKEIDSIIRGHYFNEQCPHNDIMYCKAFILSEIIKITGYKPRMELPK